MENLIKLRVFRDETTEIFNNIINNVRKFKDKSFIDQIDPFDDKYSEINTKNFHSNFCNRI